MTATTIRVQMAQRKDTAANWTAANPILLSGEIGYETDTKKFKIGDGTTNWNGLAYLPIPDGSGNLTITGNLEIGNTGSLIFEGSTADGFETTLTVTDPTADRTITLPNVSGTVVTTGDTGSVTSTMIADGTIVDADVSATAEIAVSKLANGTANQVIVTDGTNVSWSDDLTLAGNLTVNGTTTTVNTETLVVEDKNIELGVVGTPTDLTADGGGITLKGTTDKTINWVDATDSWTSSERFSVPLGSAASPSLTFTGDPNSGIYSPGADQVAISTNGTGRLSIDANGNVAVDTNTLYVDAVNNRVAVGTTSPSRKLQVEDGIASGTFNLARLSSYNGTNAKFLDIRIDNAEADPSIILDAGKGGGSSPSLAFQIGSSERARIDSSGRLLVGTSSTVTFPGGNNLSVQSAGTTASSGFGVSRWSANTGSTGLYIAKSRGSSVGSRGVVSSGDSLGIIDFSGDDGTNFVTAASIIAAVDGTPGANDMPGRLVFSTTADGASSPTERMRISNDGRTDAFATSETLRVRTAATTAAASIAIRLQAGATSITAGGTTEFQVTSNGNVANTNNSYGAISDIKLKENIVDANSQWDDIKALRPVNYNFKEGQTHTQLGLIAQEVELVSPGLVSESPDLDEDGNDLGTVTKSVNYSVLYMKAVKALQEAMERIETLEAKVAALEAS